MTGEKLFYHFQRAAAIFLFMMLTQSVIGAETNVNLAVIKQISGTILVNQGRGYKRLAVDTQLYQGDRILVMAGASGVLLEGGRCRTHIFQNTVFTLQDQNLCKIGTRHIKRIGPYFASAIGAEIFNGSTLKPQTLKPKPVLSPTSPQQNEPTTNPTGREGVPTSTGSDQPIETINSGHTSATPASSSEAEIAVVNTSAPSAFVTSASIFGGLSVAQTVLIGVGTGVGLAVVVSTSGSSDGSISPE